MSKSNQTAPEEPKVPNLKHLGHKDVEVARVATPQNKGAHPVKKTKKRASIPDDELENTDFMMKMKQLAADEEPPIYSSQGADVGRTRGRKPNKDKEVKGGKKVRADKKGGSRKKGKQVKKSHSKNKRGGKSKGIGKFKKLRKATRRKSQGSHANSLVESGQPWEEGENWEEGERREEGESREDCEAEGIPFHHGPRRGVPPHITAHHVYSSAYRKARSQSYGAEYARCCGKMAAAFFRETGHVDDLCGVFRNAPRAKNAHRDNAEHGDE